MKAFVSHSSKDKSVAEQIALSLKERFKVFYDEDSLPAGGSYDARIHSAIRRSDLFVFLASKHSLTKGKYSLTELKFAREKWKHPSDHVLPVMLDETEPEDLPHYLRAVTVLKRTGNLPAETRDAATKMGKRIRVRRVRNWAIVLTLVIFACFAIPKVREYLFPAPEPWDSPEWKVLHDQLREEQVANLKTADAHMERVASLYGRHPYPTETLRGYLRMVRTEISERDFEKSAYQAARHQQAIVDPQVLERMGACVTLAHEDLAATRRRSFRLLDETLQLPIRVKSAIQARSLHLGLVVRQYLKYRELGERALRAFSDRIISPSKIDSTLASLAYLKQIEVDENRDVGSPSGPVPDGGTDITTGFALELSKRLRDISPDSFEDLMRIAAQARLLWANQVAKMAYELILSGHAPDTPEHKCAKTGLHQLTSPSTYEYTKGLFVMRLTATSPGRDAGLRVGDVIIRFDDFPLNSMQDYDHAVQSATVSEVAIRIVREGQLQELTVPKGRLGAELVWY